MRPSHTRTAAAPRRRPSRTEPPCFEPFEARCLLDSVPIGVADSRDGPVRGDHTSVDVVRNSDFLLFEQSTTTADAWTRQSFASWLPGGFIPNSAAAFVDPSDGRVYHAVGSPTGLALILDDDAGNTESLRILTNEINGSEPIASRVAVFTSADGRVHIAGTTASGDVVLFRQTGRRGIGNQATWEFLNVSRDQLAPRGIATPVFRGDFTAVTTPWNAVSLIGLDATGDIQAVWISPADESQGIWSVTNLSEIAGTPTLLGNVAAAITPWNSVNIAGIDAAGDLVNTWWAPEFGGNWSSTNLSAAFGGPDLVPGTVFANTTPWGGINLGGATAAGDLSLTWWVPEFGPGWQVATNPAPGAERLSANGLTSFTSPAGTVNILGTSPANEVLRFSFGADRGWRAENLDAIATTVTDTLDQGDGTPNPDLEALSGGWRVTGTSGIFNDFDPDDETATILLRPDGTWTRENGSFDLSVFDSDADNGTWTFANNTITITIPDTGSTSATGVRPDASTFTTHGVTLTPAGRTRLENRIAEIDDGLPFVDLRQEINNRGGLDAVLADVDLRWTRI